MNNNLVDLILIDKLKHIEGYSDKRVEWLKKKICAANIWNKPICVDKKFGLVLDGQHRLEVAKQLKFKLIPVIYFDYEEIRIWSLRKNHSVTHSKVITNSLSNNPYPYKTVKHAFPFPIPQIQIPLSKLL